MGEHARSVFRALQAAGEDVRMVDIYGPESSSDKFLINSYIEYLSPTLGDGVNLFCINGDEVEDSFGVLRQRNLRSPGSKNVIYPAWELSLYPEKWGAILDQFDEVWAMSAFCMESYSKATRTPIVHMPLACEVESRALLSRRYFGLQDSDYCFLFSFDFLSYVARKNPSAVLRAFEAALCRRPNADIRLVIKLNNTHRKPEDAARFKAEFAAYKDRVTITDGTLSELEMKSLLWLCDCFVSLHRSEGYGRGMSEAMALGKPTIATAYSGNMDFCNEDTCFLVPFNLIPVQSGQYPHWENQVWADADAHNAADFMVHLIDNPDLGVQKGRRARAHMAAEFSFLRRGLDYANRCNHLVT